MPKDPNQGDPHSMIPIYFQIWRLLRPHCVQHRLRDQDQPNLPPKPRISVNSNRNNGPDVYSTKDALW